MRNEVSNPNWRVVMANYVCQHIRKKNRPPTEFEKLNSFRSLFNIRRKVFTRILLIGIAKQTFSYFCFYVWPEALFMSNKLTHYLLDYNDLNTTFRFNLLIPLDLNLVNNLQIWVFKRTKSKRNMFIMIFKSIKYRASNK